MRMRLLIPHVVMVVHVMVMHVMFGLSLNSDGAGGNKKGSDKGKFHFSLLVIKGRALRLLKYT